LSLYAIFCLDSIFKAFLPNSNINPTVNINVNIIITIKRDYISAFSLGLFVFIINYEETLVLIYGIQTTIYYYNPSAISKKILPLLFSEQPKRITIGSLLNPTPAQLASPSTSNAELGGQAVSTAAISPEKAFKKECEAAHENAKLRLKPGEKLINANSANPIDHILTIEKQIDIAHEKAKTMLKDGDRLINSSSLKPADHISYSRKLADDNTPLLGKSLIE